MIKFYISVIACTIVFATSCSSYKKKLADKSYTDTFSIVKPTPMDASDVGKRYNNVNFQIDLFQKNISFYGANLSENWELFIKEDSNFTFKLNGAKTVFEFSKPSQAQDASILRYHSKNVILTSDTSLQKKTITIVISEEQNLEKTSTRYLPFTVVINRAGLIAYSEMGGTSEAKLTPVIEKLLPK